MREQVTTAKEFLVNEDSKTVKKANYWIAVRRHAKQVKPFNPKLQRLETKRETGCSGP